MFLLCLIFFFSSRRRHTRLQGDWSSDVCSSDLANSTTVRRSVTARTRMLSPPMCARSEERRVGKSVDLGGRRIIKKKKKQKKNESYSKKAKPDKKKQQKIKKQHN